MRFISNELIRLSLGQQGRKVVMEQIFDHDLIHPNLPHFYFKPKEAKIHARVVYNLREELQHVKGVHLAEKLA